MRLLEPTTLAVLLAGLTLGASPAGAETTQCTAITSLPYTITAQGIYCLTDDLSTTMTSGNAIEIQANNVILDLGGHRLGGSAAGLGTTAFGVFAVQRQNLVVRNGTIRGFYVAVWVDDVNPPSATGVVIEDLRIDQATYEGISVGSRGALIRRNQVLFTGGSTNNDSAIAIVATGPENRILGNDVVTVTKQGGGTSKGIFVSGVGETGVFVVGNRLTQADKGIEFFGPGVNGKYRDNLTRNVAVPYNGGTDAGNNN
jgi:hypothetical protein